MFKYHNLEKTVVGLSPMDGVTDVSYREIMKRYGNQDLTYTEFQNVHGLSLGIENLFDHFLYTPNQRIILAQIYGHEVEYFFPATLICLLLGFDGVDINMGCPAKKISDRGAGAGLIRYPQKAQEIISEVCRAREKFKLFFRDKSTQNLDKEDLVQWLDHLLPYSGNILDETTIESANKYHEKNLSWKSLKINWKKIVNLVCQKLSDWEISNEKDSYKLIQTKLDNITISVKTRIGYDRSEVESWIPNLVMASPDFIAIHGRTLKQMYTGTADWSEIAKAIDIGKNLNSNICFLANGDIKDCDSAIKCIEITNADGLLIGRGTYGDPILIRNVKQILNGKDLDLRTTLTIQELKKIIVDHTKLYEEFHPDNFFGMRKNLAWYISNMPNAVDIRKKLVLTNNSSEVIEILNNILVNQL